MLFVAIQGPVGSAKTSQLREFARFVMDQGDQVDGFVSLAGHRLDYSRGADDYTLLWLRTGDRQLLAKRNEAGEFQTEADTFEAIEHWAETLPPKSDLVVMDEFGKWEAEGKGLVPFWSSVEAARPRVVAVTLREGIRSEIEARLGRKFDRVFDSDDLSTPSSLRQMYAELRDWELVGSYGASAGGIEASLGSWLHAARFPLTGTVMGSIQVSMLTLASRNLGRKELVVWISTIAAGLKAFSPAGSRIGPMIAIAAQGLLFTVGATVGRWSRFGFIFGAFLVGLWAALQGFFIQYLLLGRSLERAWGVGVAFVRQKLGISAPNIWVAVTVLSAVNGVICVFLTLIILKKWSGRQGMLEPYERTSSLSRQVMFWLPLVLVASILFVAGERPSSILWMLLRALAVVASMVGLGKLLAHYNFARLLGRLGWGPTAAIRAANEHRAEN